APAVAPRVVDDVFARIAIDRVVTDVVIAGYRVPGHWQFVEARACEVEIARVVRTVDAQITEVDDEGGTRCLHVLHTRDPVRAPFRCARRQMRVGDDHDARAVHVVDGTDGDWLPNRRRAIFAHAQPDRILTFGVGVSAYGRPMTT